MGYGKRTTNVCFNQCRGFTQGGQRTGVWTANMKGDTWYVTTNVDGKPHGRYRPKLR